MKRTLVTSGCITICLLLAWVQGFDFNERGMAAFFVSLYTIMVAGFVFFWPGWKK